MTGDSFAGAVRDVLEKECSPERLRAAWGAPDGRVPGLWQRLADLGVFAITVPEAHGGLGLSAVELVDVLVEIGRYAVPEPVVPTCVGSALLAASGGPLAEDALPRVAAGAAVLAVGTDALVWDAACADAVLLCRDEVVVAVAAANAELVAEPSVDAGVRLARVAGTGERLAGVDRALALDRGALATAAQLVGLGLGLLEQATSYAGTRHQFGRAIGSFQAVKHHLADVYIALSFAGPVVRRAAATLDPVDISHAKSAAADAAQLAARVALQVHGAIGYTFEHDLHMWLKRVWSLAPLFGDAATHRRRVADALLDG